MLAIRTSGRRWIGVATLVLVAAWSLGIATSPAPSGDVAADEPRYETVSQVASRETWDRMKPIHRRMLATLVANNVRRDATPLATCWYATPDEADVIAAFNAAISLGASESGDYQTSTRWTSTATNGGGLTQGQPTTIRYSFIPDGTSIPSGNGEAVAPSNLFAWLNGIYGSAAVWQQIFHDEFARWSDLTGIDYIYEPSDDGAAPFGASGSIGVRGDVRICAKPLDGNFGVLAYNFFPNGGEMVIDSSDSFFSNTSTDSRRLRNVITHEHGHGIGLSHVCPDVGTKLMEPFANTVFLGPQDDDIQGGQRQYGDPLEPNDTSLTATPLGTLADGLHTVEMVSTDDNSDVDWYAFTVGGARNVSLTLRPIGSLYSEGQQVSNCGTVVTQRNSLTVSNLGLELRGPSANTILATANSAGAGLNETITAFTLSAAGTYYVRVFPDATNDIQRYELDIALVTIAPPPFAIAFPAGVAPSLVPGVTTPVTVTVTNSIGNGPNTTSGLLYASVDGGPFTTSPLTFVAGNTFQATLPALDCLERLDWYVTLAEVGTGAVVTGPNGAPGIANASQADQVTLQPFHADSFVANNGWTVVNDAALTDGAWTRGTPVGGGVRGDPPTGFDADNTCWLTDNVAGNSDVDGGATTLYSPIFDLSAHPDGMVSFAFWYDNDFGSNPNQDTFKIEISQNNATWIRMETYNASVDAWVQRSFRLKDFITPTATVRFRFIADDPDPGAVVEAGLDAFKIEVCETSLLGPCGAGFAGLFLGGPYDVLKVNGSAGGASRSVHVPLGAPITFSVDAVPGATAVPDFIIAGHPGIPAPNETWILGFFNGTMCFTPCLVDPLNSPGFILADTIVGPSSPCPGLLPAWPAPWQFTLPSLPFPFVITLQGGINDGDLRTTNGVILYHGL